MVSHWVPLIAWMLVIFTASTDLGSAAHSARLLVPFLRWINPQISPAGIEVAHFIVRKAAHLAEYAVFALLLLRALHSTTRRAFARQAAIALAVAAFYAATDEFHQSFSDSRTASPQDVMIDCCGAVLGIAAFRWLTPRASAQELVPARARELQ